MCCVSLFQNPVWQLLAARSLDENIIFLLLKTLKNSIKLVSTPAHHKLREQFAAGFLTHFQEVIVISTASHSSLSQRHQPFRRQQSWDKALVCFGVNTLLRQLWRWQSDRPARARWGSVSRCYRNFASASDRVEKYLTAASHISDKNAGISATPV